MLAIASLATGFVVAAVTPSHAASHAADKGHSSPDNGVTVDGLNVTDTLDSAGGHPVSLDSFGIDDGSRGPA
ncbi:hypothetical protein GCM10010339_28870 [Streptomyces alanosinicus]|uniref:Chaplin n=2 Tax=Streptomyces alanosinicus TaxID=68171 RepID=A0A918YGM8_9ACTN|nr:hypothetical protein GCM10010339_28870 [Streptomyces alanosinicus]